MTQQGCERSPFELGIAGVDVSTIDPSREKEILSTMTPEDHDAHFRRTMLYGRRPDREAMLPDEIDSLLTVEGLRRVVGQ